MIGLLLRSAAAQIAQDLAANPMGLRRAEPTKTGTLDSVQ